MPTPSPIIVARVGATVPMVVTAASSEMRLNPIARPNRAVPIGRLMAITDPNASSKMSTATSRPVLSALPVLGVLNASAIAPPKLTCSPACVAGAAARPQLGERRGGQAARLLGHTGPARSRCWRSGTRTRSRPRGGRAEHLADVGEAGHPLLGRPDRGERRRVADAAVLGVEHDRGHVARLAREPLREEVGGRCDGAPGIVKVSWVLPSAAWAADPMTTTMPSQAPITHHRWRAAARPSRSKRPAIGAYPRPGPVTETTRAEGSRLGRERHAALAVGDTRTARG